MIGRQPLHAGASKNSKELCAQMVQNKSRKERSAANPGGDLAARVAVLEEIVDALSISAADHEAGYARLCAALGLDSPPRRSGQWVSIKYAASETGYSESNIRKLRRAHLIDWDVRGGKVSIELESVLKYREKRKCEKTV